MNLQNIPLSQIQNVPMNAQPLISSLLSPYSTMPFVDKIGAIANVIQKTPSRPGRSSGLAAQRQYMAEALKKSALESLMVAANACKCCGIKAESAFPVPKPQMAIGGDIAGKRAVKVKYL